MTYQPSVFKRYQWQTFLRVYIQDVRYKAKINWHRYGTNYVTVTVCIPPEWFCVPCPKLREMHQQLSGRPNYANKTTNQVHMCTFGRLNESLRRSLLEICGVSEHFPSSVYFSQQDIRPCTIFSTCITALTIKTTTMVDLLCLSCTCQQTCTHAESPYKRNYPYLLVVSSGSATVS